MNVTLWSYLPAQKRLIMEEALANDREVMFYNHFGEFELISNFIQIINPSFDFLLENIKKKKDLALLCPEDSCKKLKDILKKKKVRFVEKEESFI